MQIIMDEIIEESPNCTFGMVAGQLSAKQALQVSLHVIDLFNLMQGVGKMENTFWKKFKKVDPDFSAIETRYGSGYRWNVS